MYTREDDVARLAYFGLFALQHRGQEFAGIATAPRGGNVMAIREQGLVAQVFNEHRLRSLVYRHLQSALRGTYCRRLRSRCAFALGYLEKRAHGALDRPPASPC